MYTTSYAYRARVVFSERELGLSACLSSVTFVHPTQAIDIFGNVSMPCGTLAIRDLCIKILRRSSHGNPFVGGLNPRGIAKYSDFRSSRAISRKRYKFVLITNRKFYI